MQGLTQTSYIVIIYLMRTIITLSDEHIHSLEVICKKENISRSEAIRQAVHQYIEIQKPKNMDQAFGIWKERDISALLYEEELRSEFVFPMLSFLPQHKNSTAC